MENEVVLFESSDKEIEMQVKLIEGNVWLTRNQLAELFDRDVKTIGKHIHNALNEEVDLATVAKFAIVQTEGDRKIERQIEHYNLEMITSVGYRVKSHRGFEFRRWANGVLKEYILKGYAVNQARLQQLGSAVRLMKRVEKELDARQVLDVIERFGTALDLLDAYDHQTMKRPKGAGGSYVLEYEECRRVIEQMKFAGQSELFGKEKDDSFKGSIGNIYQSFAGQEIYPTVEEKAANLLYFVTKNHSFWDGNKRIAAAMFLYFLDRNGILFDEDGNKMLDDHTLVALTIMIAESKPEEKEMMVSVILNCIGTQE